MAKKTERELVESARDNLRKAEAYWGKAVSDVRGIVAFNADAGNAALSNAAFGVAGHLTEMLAYMMQAHAAGTDVLLANWPDYADAVTKGPGR